MIRRVLLVGFMGSGKSTVGPLLAHALSWRFVDFDDRIVEEEGRSVARIFAEDGEPYFREVEDRVARALMDERDVVIGSGGGWGAVPGRLASLPTDTLSVWLRVSPDVAVARAASSGERPLLAGPDPVGTARRLLEIRTPSYADATVEVDTDGRPPIDVSRTLLALVERRRRDAEAGT